jgi:hypothetical protein
VNEREQRQFIRFLAMRLKSLYRELTVYRIFAETLKEMGQPGLDVVMESASRSPLIEAEMQRNFAEFDELIPSPDEENPDDVLRDLLERWKPDGEPN